MELVISSLVQRFERGGLSRRQLIQGLSLLAMAGSATAVTADDANGAQQAGATGSTGAAGPASAAGLRATGIGHLGMQVSDVQRSADFYARVFGLAVLSQDAPNKIMRLGVTGGGTLVSLRQAAPSGIVDHVALSVENFNRDAVTEILKARGVTPRQDAESGFHVKDPDGANVQIT
jgi:catechol 2,3-dioxygenase-like lactoylglutathione lyase family enzyme